MPTARTLIHHGTFIGAVKDKGYLYEYRGLLYLYINGKVIEQ